MSKGNVEVLNEVEDGWCSHCWKYHKLIYEATIQWPDRPDLLAEGCARCLEEIALGEPPEIL